MIEIRNLIRRFSEETTLCYADHTFEDGKTYALLGASGCGKSTLLNMIAGILSPTSGSILIDGRDMTRISQREKDAFRIARIGYIFQDFKLIEEMTVVDNIDILKLEKVDTSHTDEILEQLGILKLKKRRVQALSGGEKQRVAIARALVKKPSIILADEPTGNLNYAVGRTVVESLIDSAKGHTLLCVTHDERLRDCFDEVVDMNDLVACRSEGGERNV